MNSTLEKKKVLVTYFSHSGNTKTIAGFISNYLKSDIFEIKSTDIYTTNYQELVKVAMQELKSDYTPELLYTKENIDDYDVIFVGFPNWRNTFPMPVKSFLEAYDFSNKIIIPFVTHEGSGMGRSVSDFKKYCPNSKVLAGFSIWGSESYSSQKNVEIILDNMNF